MKEIIFGSHIIIIGPRGSGKTQRIDALFERYARSVIGKIENPSITNPFDINECNHHTKFVVVEEIPDKFCMLFWMAMIANGIPIWTKAMGWSTIRPSFILTSNNIDLLPFIENLFSQNVLGIAYKIQ